MEKKHFSSYYESPIGIIKITCSSKSITSLEFTERLGKNESHPLLEECALQISEYFQGKRKKFRLSLSLKGTPFQKKVWSSLIRIPYGKTKSYRETALTAGNPLASRAVGNANNKNNFPIILPCHRVITSNGSIGGYGSGIWRKKWLLEHEEKNSTR